MEFFTFVQAAEYVNTYFIGDYYKEYLWQCFLIGFLLYAVIYVFEAVALYTIAKREGYKNRWMAFVPFVNTYYIGVVSDKNSMRNVKSSQIALVAAIAEFLMAAGWIIYYVAVFMIFNGKYAVLQTEYDTTFGVTYVTGYVQAADMPASLNWAYWCFANFENYVLYWIELIYIFANAFVLVSFFRTYSSARYVAFSIFAILFPVKSILMFAVRNNRGKNYGEYLRAKQARQYEAYKEYMRRRGQDGNQYNYNPYTGRPTRPDDNPYGSSSSSSGGADDPFDEFSSSGNNGSNNGDSDGNSSSSSDGSNKPDDPFSDF